MRNSGVIRYEGKRGVVWRIKYVDANGVQIQETLGKESEGWTRKKAKAELRERVVRVEKKNWTKPSALTFAGYADQWFERGQAHRSWSTRTVSGYRGVLTRLKEDLGALSLASIRPSRITEYVAWASEVKKQGPASLNRDITLLHDIFKSAKREELIETNPADDVERPKIVQRKWRILEPAEIRAVLKEFEDEQARTVFLTVALTALRRHELQNLRWRDIILTDPERGPYMRVRKSKSESGVRNIPITPTLADALFEHRSRSPYQGEDELVFCSKSGRTFDDKTYAEQFRAALKSAGIEDYVRPFHDMRHSSIANDAAAGANPTALMAKAGHSDMKTTKGYLHLAGVVFRDETEALERRLLGASVSPVDVMEGAG
jgi:integrase